MKEKEKTSALAQKRRGRFREWMNEQANILVTIAKDGPSLVNALSHQAGVAKRLPSPWRFCKKLLSPKCLLALEALPPSLVRTQTALGDRAQFSRSFQAAPASATAPPLHPHWSLYLRTTTEPTLGPHQGTGPVPRTARAGVPGGHCLLAPLVPRQLHRAEGSQCPGSLRSQGPLETRGHSCHEGREGILIHSRQSHHSVLRVEPQILTVSSSLGDGHQGHRFGQWRHHRGCVEADGARL